MNRKTVFVIVALMLSAGLFAQHGSLTGLISDSKTGDAIPFALVQLFMDDQPGPATIADIDGNYTLKGVQPGNYRVRSAVVGYKSVSVDGVLIRNRKKDVLNLSLISMANRNSEVEIIQYKVPQINKENTPVTYPLTATDIEKMPGRSVLNIYRIVRMSNIPSDIEKVIWQLALYIQFSPKALFFLAFL